MAKAANSLRPHFEESDFDDAEYHAQFAYRAGLPNLPPVEFKVEDIADSASPEEMLRAAIEERTIATELHADGSFGPVVIPAEKTLFGYKYALSDSGHDIRFSHKTYGIFDEMIVKACGVDASDNPTHTAFNPKMEYYTFYSPLRRNIAILRNYLMGIYPPSRNPVNQATLKAMASKLGRALHGQEERKLSLIERILWTIRKLMMKGVHYPVSNRFIALANVPDRGISFMYQYLVEQQASPNFLEGVPAAQLPKNWKLAGLEETPFSSANIAQYSNSARMGLIASAFELVARNLKSVDDMTPNDKEVSVEHARDILKNLRIIFSGVQEEKQYDEMDPRCREAQSMLNAALAYQGALAHIARDEPDLLNDPLIREASKAIVKIGTRVRGEEEAMHKQEHRAETTTASPPQQQQQQPSQSKSKSSRSSDRQRQRSRESIQRLIFRFDEGINRAAEIRRANITRARQRSASMQQALSKESSVLPRALSEGQSTMANPKIHQVSINDPDFIEAVKKANEERAIEQAKATPGGGRSAGSSK